MKFNEKWLREWVNPTVTTAQLSHQLTMAGLEVDAIEPVAPDFDAVVVGAVLAVNAHPDADRLRVCSVDVGDSEPLTIVCGAPNVAEGQKVPTALVGANLPNGLKIKQAKLRGVESRGMLCSAAELGLAESAEGLMVLPEDAQPGRNIRDYLALDDVTIEIGLTPNRGDCLSLRGVAREVAVANELEYSEPSVDDIAVRCNDVRAVSIEAVEACPRYMGRVICGINPAVETPLWMQERLRRCGVRSISPVVDVTNYVMLELGQPMHAFDLDKIQGEVRVRYARPGESLKLLDGQTIDMTAETLVIADERVPLAMAGIMGGEASAVSESTRHIFLESAFFSPAAMAGKARSFGLHTDSSHRFERGVDPELADRAIARATALLLELVGGEAGPITDVVHADHVPVQNQITLRAAQVRRILGITIAEADIALLLTRLGMEVRPVDGGWQVVAPGYRFDIAIEADLIEEIGRIYGYSRIPANQPHASLCAQLTAERVRSMDEVQNFLIAKNYQEVVTYSFVDPQLQKQITPQACPIALTNPISSDMAEMRTSLWPGLLQTLVFNVNRQQKRLRIFEVGSKFSKQHIETVENKVIAGLVAGPLSTVRWDSKLRNADFYDVKGDVEALLTLTGKGESYTFTPCEHPALHPGQSASIGAQTGDMVGWVGAVHPSLLRQLGVDIPVFLFELECSIFEDGSIPKFTELSKYPSVQRDLALVVDETVPASAIRQTIITTSERYLENLELFDVYVGKGIEKGKKSLAFGLTFQDVSRTLTDREIESLEGKILDQLRIKHNATLRE